MGRAGFKLSNSSVRTRDAHEPDAAPPRWLFSFRPLSQAWGTPAPLVRLLTPLSCSLLPFSPPAGPVHTCSGDLAQADPHSRHAPEPVLRVPRCVQGLKLQASLSGRGACCCQGGLALARALPHIPCCWHAAARAVYRTADRRGVLATTGHSTNFLMMIRMPSLVVDPDVWTLRGACGKCGLWEACGRARV